MNTAEMIKLATIVGGFLFTILSTIVIGAMAWSKISAKTDSLEATDKKQWDKIDGLEKWTVSRDKTLSDMRLELEKEIGLIRENTNNTRTKLDTIINQISELNSKITSMQEQLFQRKKGL